MIYVVVRCRNDVQLLPATLAGIRRQTVPCRIVAFDNASTDGSREILAQQADTVIDVPEGKYVPGRVLNDAMRASDSDLVVFLNSDCEPRDEYWLAELIAVMEDPQAAAGFGRQEPRPDCLPWFARDTENTFGDGKQQAKWRHCFSMASSIVRRDVWEQMPFDEEIPYSEDIEWTWRAKQAGYHIPYAPDSRVYHSHNYTWHQYYRRQFGEGKAEAQIFEWDFFATSWLRYSFLPYVRQVAGDVKYCLRLGKPLEALKCPYVRTAQLLGRRKGFSEAYRKVLRERLRVLTEESRK